MGWQSVGQFQLTRDWQLSEPVIGRLFRVRHTVSPLLYHRGLIAQAFNGSQGVELLTVRKLFAKGEADIYEFNRPLGLNELANRRIAVRRYDTYSNPWTVEIEVLEGSENSPSPSPSPTPTPDPESYYESFTVTSLSGPNAGRFILQRPVSNVDAAIVLRNEVQIALYDNYEFSYYGLTDSENQVLTIYLIEGNIAIGDIFEIFYT